MRVAVLGAGLQGACVALELARRGVEVDLVDRAELPMTGASTHNEGKVHLGYVYANDPTRRTARTMIEGALEFGPRLRAWVGDDLDDVTGAAPFSYVVHRDSLLDVAEVERHFADCHAMPWSCSTGASPTTSAVTPDPSAAAERGGGRARFDPATVLAAYATSELAVEPCVPRDRRPPALTRTPGIRLRSGTEVRAVTRLRGRGARAHRTGPTTGTTSRQRAVGRPAGDRRDRRGRDRASVALPDEVLPPAGGPPLRCRRPRSCSGRSATW